MGAELPRRRKRGAEPKIKFVRVATSPGDLELCQHFTRVNSEFILSHQSTTKIVRPLEIGLSHSRPIGWPAATSRSSPNLETGKNRGLRRLRIALHMAVG